MHTEYAVYLGLDVGKTNHHGCGLDSAGERVFHHELPQDKAALSAVITTLKHDYDRVLVIAVAGGCGADIACPPGVAIRKAADLYPGQAKTDARDAFIIADAASTVPHILRSVGREPIVLAILNVLVETDEDLAHVITRTIDRSRSLLLQIHLGFGACHQGHGPDQD